MSIINTGINIIASGVDKAKNQLKQFGLTIEHAETNVKKFAKQFNSFTNMFQSNSRNVKKSSSSLSSALSMDWKKINDSLHSSAIAQERDLQRLESGYNNFRRTLFSSQSDLQRLENAYDRTFRNIGNKYQSMVMGSVALSMSGISIKNAGTAILGGLKGSLDVAKDFETVMRQIEFYGHRTDKEMESIKKNVFKLGYDLPVTTSEIANSVLEAQKTGYDNLNDAMKMAAEASKIQFMSLGKMDGGESLKYISQLRKMMGFAVKDVDKLTDKLAMTADVSSASIDSLWKTVQSSRTAYNSLNTDPDTFLTLMGVMSDRLTPRQAGMALSSFGGGVLMAEKAAREGRGTRGAYYKQLTKAMGGNLDSYKGDILKYIQDVAETSKKLWGEGSGRSSILASVFGRSAVDLFYAYDQFTKQTGKSMTQLRQAISDSDGHAKKLIDTLMNGSYGTEERLKALKEQFQILFGSLIRPVFNKILDALSGILTKVNKFIENHPKLAKALGYGVGLAGLLLTAAGASMVLVGGLLAIYASLNNVIIQIARNTKVMSLLGEGYRNAGDMIKARMLNPLKLLSGHLLKVSGLSFFLYMAWRHDFLGMRTTFLEWQHSITKGLGESKRLFGIYAKGSVQEFDQALRRSETRNTLADIIGRRIAKIRMAYDALKTMFKHGGVLPKDQYQKLKDAGLLPVVEKIYNTIIRIRDFWRGFVKGVKNGIEILKDILKPLFNIFKWIYDKVIGLLQHFGFFTDEAGKVSSKWEQWGKTVGNIVGLVIGIRLGIYAWGKAIKTVVSPFKLIAKIVKGIWDIIKKFKNFRINPLKLGTSLLLPRGVRKTGGRLLARRYQGAYQNLPNAQPNIDPQTKRPIGTVSFDTPTDSKLRKTREGRRTLRRLNRARRKQPIQFVGKDGASGTVQGRGIKGRLMDFLYGRQYVPDVNYDSKNRKYYSIRTKQGRYTRTSPEGLVKGEPIRTGGFIGGIKSTKAKIGKVGSRTGQAASRLVTKASLMNMINFMDAGMDYDASVGRRGHRLRSIKAGIKGTWNRMRNPGFMFGGNSLANKMGGELSKGLTTSLKGIKIGRIFGTMGKTGGKAMVKGLGLLIRRGIPLIFKTALRAIPILGWALTAWQIIETIFTNWKTIKRYAGTALHWIGNKAKSLLHQAWEQIKTSAGNMWQSIKTKAYNTWTSIKEWAVNKVKQLKDSISTSLSNLWTNIKESAKTALENIFQPIKDAWQNAKDFIAENPIVQTVTKVVKSVKESKWNPLNWIPHRTGLWKVPRDNYPALLHNGEMVLTQREAQILRSMVGSDSNSVARTLLESQKREATNITVAKSGTPRTLKITKANKNKEESSSQKVEHKTEIIFKEGAIKVDVKNASPSEMKKGAKLMFEEFKRMVELENMKNFKPARPRKPRPV